ncbi:MAG: hypothetical protein EB832_03215 [Thaumarchaeota archaeon S14]|nr:MAG: hypothetical protein EB832_03215 [Thaumarchaeota archaeon S14]
MASRAAVTLVFVLPAIASVALGGAVMAQMLQEPGRGGGAGHVSLVGLEGSYAAPAALSVSVSVGHDAFDCGDLDIVVRDAGGQTVGQGGFFGQCFALEGTEVPVGGPFTLGIEAPGEYEITATMTDAQKRSRATATEAFTVN